MATEEMRFDGQVAIVTGGGSPAPSLGRAYAKYLAARGAKVVVNRRGRGYDGRGTTPVNPHEVVDEIIADGGEAIGDLHSVADSHSAREVVHTAIDRWGRVDILINNAGVNMHSYFDEISDDDLDAVMQSHLYGHLWMARAVWPHMRAAGRGRIVNVVSEALFGSPAQVVYGTAKAGVIGLTNNLAAEGIRYGIKTNAVSPVAASYKHPLMFNHDPERALKDRGDEVNQVAAVVAYLSHEDCEPNGGVFYASKGDVREYRMYETVGISDPDLTMERMRHQLAAIRNQTGAVPHTHGFDPSRLDTVYWKPYIPS